jgi:hypothetical protein
MTTKERRHGEGKVFRHWLGFLSGAAIVSLLMIGICVWLWHVEWLRPWLASFGTALVALVGPIPGLLSPETRSKWLILVGVAALIGVGTWYATKYEEDQREEARDDATFSQSLLRRAGPDVGGQLCRAAACPLREMLHQRDYRRVERNSSILRNFDPANGHALYFAGEAYLGLEDYGQMLTAFRSYLYNADKIPAEAYIGDANQCYFRNSGYCAERTAWVEHLLANYFFTAAQKSKGSERVAALQQVLTELGYMLRSRKIGFNADLTTHDTEDLLRQTVEELKSLNQDPRKAELLLSQVDNERWKAAKTVPQPGDAESPCAQPDI